MNRLQKTLIILLSLTFFVVEGFATSTVIPARGKFETRFLLVIDRDSYDYAREEVTEYKRVLESQGLGVVILIGEWSKPSELREEIRIIYKERPVLEGAAFAGKIPVARIRNFQHATTAFKMDEERFPITESSVTSDRFYDDMDLEFELLEQCSENPLHFYYKLKESSPQIISSDFYSARMMPPSDYGIDEKILLKNFFKKAVAAHKEINYADNLVIFNGHAYNSDCLTVWQNQQFAIKEQFPQAFKSSVGNGFYNFRQDPFTKFKLYERMQRDNTDIFVFHEHGAFDTQYINGEYPAPFTLGFTSSGVRNAFTYNNTPLPAGPAEAMTISLRNTYRRYSGERAAAFKKRMIEEFGFKESFFDTGLLNNTKSGDSLFAANVNITLPDLIPLNFGARVSIFDACYNASFHKPGYVAGYHVFGDGRTVVAQGNTVNVLQDKWSLELFGMLAEGIRIGFWQKEIQTLESHLIGDPTFRFTPKQIDNGTLINAKVLNNYLALRSNDTRLWMELFRSENPNLKSLAIKQLSKNRPAGYSDLLLKTLKESDSYVVRMQALRRLIELSDRNLNYALVCALDDPYELIRRHAARFSGFSGHTSLIDPLVHTMLFSNESQRVQFSALSSLQMFEADDVVESINRQAAESNLLNRERAVSGLSEYIMAQQRSQQNNLAAIMDKSAETDKRVSAIRWLRNYNNHKQVNQLLKVLEDDTDDPKIRETLAEALGWFNWSINKAEIIESLNKVYKNETTPHLVRIEAEQSLRRISAPVLCN